MKTTKMKLPTVNQHRVVYRYECDLCDADYVGYTSSHLHQRIDTHKRLVIGNHVRECHGEDALPFCENDKENTNAYYLKWYV